jgi:group I intron endonuclease
MGHRSAIYEIRNLTNGCRYIGSSINVGKRLSNHRSDLNKGTHHSPYLQRAWDKYGEGAFFFGPLVMCEPQELRRMEQELLTRWKPEYNGSPEALDRPYIGPIQRAAMSARMAGSKRAKGNRSHLGQTPGQATRDKIRSKLMGNTNSLGKLRSDASKMKTSESLKEHWRVCGKVRYERSTEIALKKIQDACYG